MHKKWKYDKSDDQAARRWDTYQKVYEDIIQHCKQGTPWIIVPADKKWYRNYFVAKTIVERLEGLKMKFPN